MTLKENQIKELKQFIASDLNTVINNYIDLKWNRTQYKTQQDFQNAREEIIQCGIKEILNSIKVV